MSNPADFVIENGVLKKYVGPGGDVEIPDSVREIGYSAFSGCKSLASVTIPDSVTEIGWCAFEGCDALERIQATSKASFDLLWKNISEKAKFGFLVQGLHDQNADPFLLSKIKANKKKLFAFAIQKDDEEVASRLFALYKKTPLEELDEAIVQAEGAPKVRTFLLSYKAAKYSLETQEKIAEIATEKELGLRERTLSDWKKIYLFESCAGGICIKNYKGDELDILIPEKIGKEKVVAIGKGAFSPEGKRITEEQSKLRSRLTSVVISEGVTKIDYMAFSGCTSLVSITIPDSVTEIGNYAFEDCTSLATIAIPDSVTELGDAAFGGCTSLASVTIPDGVTKISEYAFRGCESLASVTIPAGVVEIGDLAFGDCTSLTSVIIPEGVEKISEYAFDGCTSLTIHAPAGSYTEKYAKKNNIPFVAE